VCTFVPMYILVQARSCTRSIESLCVLDALYRTKMAADNVSDGDDVIMLGDMSHVANGLVLDEKEKHMSPSPVGPAPANKIQMAQQQRESESVDRYDQDMLLSRKRVLENCIGQYKSTDDKQYLIVTLKKELIQVNKLLDECMSDSRRVMGNQIQAQAVQSDIIHSILGQSEYIITIICICVGILVVIYIYMITVKQQVQEIRSYVMNMQHVR